jgi:hypothetical protein
MLLLKVYDSLDLDISLRNCRTRKDEAAKTDKTGQYHHHPHLLTKKEGIVQSG